MTLRPQTLRRALEESLLAVAPEADLASLRPDRPLREELDLDSFDFLRVLEQLHTRTGISVPEADYGRLRTLDEAWRYLTTR